MPQPTLDEEWILTLRRVELAGRAGLIRELIVMYLRDTPKTLKEIEAAFAAGDSEGVGHLTHTLKGASGNLGLREMEAMCGQIHDTCRRYAQGDHGEIPRDLFGNLGKRYDEADRALTSLLSRVSGNAGDSRDGKPFDQVGERRKSDDDNG